MNFEEFDDVTRSWMHHEFEAEEASGNAYRGKGLSASGRTAFPDLMRDAIREGTEATLTVSLARAVLWDPTEDYTRKGVVRSRRVNVQQASERLSLTEFNTWYVRGLSRRLIEEGVTRCQVYRASVPKWEPADCSQHEGQVHDVGIVYDGHRARYWPEPGNPSAISIPYGPGCHHTIRGLR